jgi:ankyrin repeat protein
MKMKLLIALIFAASLNWAAASEGNFDGRNATLCAIPVQGTFFPALTTDKKRPENLIDAITVGADSKTLESFARRSSVNRPFQQGITPLMYAAVIGNWPAMNALISLGAEIDLKTEAGTALLSAVAGNRYDIACALIEAGATLPRNIEDQHTLMRTAFIVEKAQFHDAAVFIDFLLSNNFDPHDMGDKGYTPLMAAVALNSSSLTEVFLKHGADPMVHAKSGRTTWDIAREKQSAEIIRILQIKASEFSSPKN